MGRTLLILREPEIRRVLDMASCVEAVEKAFTAYATGGAELPAVINLDVREHRREAPGAARRPDGRGRRLRSAGALPDRGPCPGPAVPRGAHLRPPAGESEELRRGAGAPPRDAAGMPVRAGRIGARGG